MESTDSGKSVVPHDATLSRFGNNPASADSSDDEPIINTVILEDGAMLVREAREDDERETLRAQVATLEKAIPRAKEIVELKKRKEELEAELDRVQRQELQHAEQEENARLATEQTAQQSVSASSPKQEEKTITSHMIGVVLNLFCGIVLMSGCVCVALGLSVLLVHYTDIAPHRGLILGLAFTGLMLIAGSEKATT